MSSADEDRARLERLIAAADRVVSQPIPPPAEQPSRIAAMTALAIVGVAALVLGVKLASGSDEPSVSTAGQTTAVPTVPNGSGTATSTTIPTVITVPPVPSSPTTLNPTTLSPTTISPTTISPVTTTTWSPTPGQPVRSAVYLDGRLRLDGAVPDSRTATKLAAKWGAAFGASNVTVNVAIAFGVPLPAEEPLYAHDAMQFPPQSAALPPAATALLDRLAVLLADNPNVTLDIDAYTDDVGDNVANLQLTQFRAGAVVIYLAGAGIDPARLVATGHGEASPVADNATAEGRIQNQRVEFTVHHLLD